MANPTHLNDDLIVRPNTRTITLSEVMQRMRGFIDQIRSVEFVIIVHRKGDPYSKLACTRNTERHVTRELLRNSLDAFDKGAIGLAD